MRSRRRVRGQGPLRPEDLLASEDQTDHKTLQLCRQVEEAISYALGSSADPVLRDLFVLEVQPVRGAGLLRVLLAIDEKDCDHREITDRLTRAQGYLRGEVARAIHRKRVPTLELTLIPPAARDSDDGVNDG
jgi:ribosome-binding factor A